MFASESWRNKKARTEKRRDQVFDDLMRAIFEFFAEGPPWGAKEVGGIPFEAAGGGCGPGGACDY